jgi:hypothetical protein
MTSTAAEPTVKMIYAAPKAHGTRGTEAQPCSLARAQAQARRLAAAGQERPTTTAPQTFTATISYTYRGVPFVAARTFTLTQLADE